MVHLKRLTNLKRLELGNTKVTRAGVAGLKQALRKCKISIILPPAAAAESTTPRDQYLDEVPLVALQKLGAKIERDDQGRVVELSLVRTKITDAGLVHIKGLANLQHLYLYRTKITNAGLVHLMGLT